MAWLDDFISSLNSGGLGQPQQTAGGTTGQNAGGGGQGGGAFGQFLSSLGSGNSWGQAAQGLNMMTGGGNKGLLSGLASIPAGGNNGSGGFPSPTSVATSLLNGMSQNQQNLQQVNAQKMAASAGQNQPNLAQSQQAAALLRQQLAAAQAQRLALQRPAIPGMAPSMPGMAGKP
ncbi:MAG: hypothetical protein WCA85_12850 [Paraburkholderia sp.]|uniref:hypothetical protein n=1 Tax=Paraburkholderia sp. TaxID=1926495 RepID=UPI003C648885